MKLDQLNYFITVAQLENLTKAAELLHISQSSLSKNIVSLENELGASLFDRNGKHLYLNPAGKRFLKSCNTIVQEYQTLKNDIHLMVTAANSRIHIGCCGSIDRLYPCMARFKMLHPEAEYSLTSYMGGMELPDINEYDVLIYPSELLYERFVGYDFGMERYLLAVPTSHFLAKYTAISLKMLNGLDFVFLRQGKSDTEYPYKVCKALTIQMGASSFTDSREMHRQMISSGIAIGFVSENCSSFYNSGSILLIPLIDSNFSRKLKICFRRDKHLTDFSRSFRDFTINYFSLTEKN